MDRSLRLRLDVGRGLPNMTPVNPGPTIEGNRSRHSLQCGHGTAESARGKRRHRRRSVQIHPAPIARSQPLYVEVVEVSVAGLERVQIQFDEVILNASGFGGSEKLLPVDHALSQRDLFLLGRRPIL